MKTTTRFFDMPVSSSIAELDHAVRLQNVVGYLNVCENYLALINQRIDFLNLKKESNTEEQQELMRLENWRSVYEETIERTKGLLSKGHALKR